MNVGFLCHLLSRTCWASPGRFQLAPNTNSVLCLCAAFALYGFCCTGGNRGGGGGAAEPQPSSEGNDSEAGGPAAGARALGPLGTSGVNLTHTPPQRGHWCRRAQPSSTGEGLEGTARTAVKWFVSNTVLESSKQAFLGFRTVLLKPPEPTTSPVSLPILANSRGQGLSKPREKPGRPKRPKHKVAAKRMDSRERARTSRRASLQTSPRRARVKAPRTFLGVSEPSTHEMPTLSCFREAERPSRFREGAGGRGLWFGQGLVLD